MASIEKPTTQGMDSPKKFYYPRILGTSGVSNGNFLITDIRKEPVDRNRPCSFFGIQLRKTVSSDHCVGSPVPSPKKTPPPVPPRTSKSFIAPSPTTPTSAKNVLSIDKDVPSIETPKKKKIPPPVPKKPTHLRLFAQRQQSTPEIKVATDTSSTMRLFALLLSPVTPTPISETVAGADNDISTLPRKRINRPMSVFGSTPHLDRIITEGGNETGDGQNTFDDNNNPLGDTGYRSGEDQSVNQKDQSGRRPTLRSQGRSARRKSLPLLPKNSAATTPTTDVYQSDGRSGVTSRCSSSFGAEQGSLISSSNLTPSSPPPPIPLKDYYTENHRFPASPKSKFSLCSNAVADFDFHHAQTANDEVESVVFFSTISTISSYAPSGDCSLENRSLGDQRREIDSARANNYAKRYSRMADRRQRAVSRTNNLLNAFALEQGRRTVSIIERNARIIKWLYGCSKN